MLSKVLSGSDGDRAQPLIFAFAPNRGASEPPMKYADAENENGDLRAQVARLEAQIEAVKRDAFENGCRQGEQKSRAEITPVIDRMNASLVELTGLRQELRRRAEKDVVQLSLLIAKRVLHREINVDPAALTALARVVFERLTSAESYRVTVHPQFAAPMRSALSGRLISRVEIEADANCLPGTFIVTSAEGTIDASVDAQLEEIGRGLTDRLAAI